MKNLIKTKTKGATLIEMMVVIGVFVLIFNVLSIFSRDVFRFSGTLYSSIQAQQDARVVLRQLAAELREISPSSTGAYPIVEALNTRLHFYSDIDNDGLRDEIIYYLSADGKTLYKNTREPSGSPLQYMGNFSTSTLVRDVSNGATAIFSYYDSAYDGTSAALSEPVNLISVRLIKAQIIIERDPNRAPVPINVTTQVSLRNLKDNL